MAEHPTVLLCDPSSALTATYVPTAGMICTSLADDGVELLGQRRGLEAYLSAAKTLGVPLLYPWANRLSGNDYRVGEVSVSLTPGTAGVHTEEHGSPIHGVLAAHPGWEVTERSDHRLVATLDWTTPELLSTFPFPHTLAMAVTLQHRTLTVDTTVTPTGDAEVPLCYGYHPYLVIPGVARRDWVLETPALRRVSLDERGLPTGEYTDWPARSAALGDEELDDGFDRTPQGAVFALSGGGRRIEVTFVRGYPAAQLFAPGVDDVVAVEPMTAPTDALRRGGYRTAVPGTPDTATFSIAVG